jgi:cyanate permease
MGSAPLAPPAPGTTFGDVGADVNNAQMVLELAAAVAAATAVIRFWRQIVAFFVAVFVGLSVIGLLTVISWVEALPRP